MVVCRVGRHFLLPDTGTKRAWVHASSQPGIVNLRPKPYNRQSMAVTVRSFAKINLGLSIGPRREDGFHELLTVYQTIGLHDLITVTAKRGSGIEIRCADPRVPQDNSNTCYRIAEKALHTLKIERRIVIEIEKRLPVQGGFGGASANAIATLLALELALDKVLKTKLSAPDRFRIAADVGSDLPLFLVGGTVLGVGRGEQVYPLQDLPAAACVVVTPEVGVSTPKAFAEWDRKLTVPNPSDTMIELGRRLSAWLSESYSGAPFRRGRRENPLLELVRAGIKNDFEQVVFPEYPELSAVKRALERAGARYTSLSGSGSALYGLFASKQEASKAAVKLRKQGWMAQATTTLSRQACWTKFLVSSF
jgi:4-diphosphocytidyl-2-C-methyl-D-erythritol kinase